MKNAIAFAAAASLLAAAASAQTIQIDGAGATFPYPIYSKWFSEYNKLHPEIQINYQSIGSGGGIRQLKAAPGPVLHFPTVLGAVVPVYNLPGLSAELKFSGPTLADIYLGKITKWNDKAIAAENPGVRLPVNDIAVVHRSDGSGTTYIFVDYLAKLSPEWKTKVGVNTSVNWPVGVGGKGNEGVSGLVSQTPNSIGYVELIYALQNKIAFGSAKSHDGEWVKATLQSVTAAAAAIEGKMPADFRVSITDGAGKGVYPISSFTWLLLYESPKDKAKGKVMVDFTKWALSEGQKYCSDLGYAPLPASVVKMEMDALGKIK
jgi:phosphate transport system substrate-binding protein